jgi:peptide deformylase
MAKLLQSDRMVGLSAPQIAQPLRIIAFQLPSKHFLPAARRNEFSEAMSRKATILVNPAIRILDGIIASVDLIHQ